MACFGLAKLGIETKPLHVALGLDNEEPSKNGGASEEGSGSGGDEDDESGDESTSDLPPFLVTFEGAATGLHLDDVDTVFVVGRPSSAASYLHLAGRVGRSSTSANGEVVIRPGMRGVVLYGGKFERVEQVDEAGWWYRSGGVCSKIEYLDYRILACQCTILDTM